MNSVCVTLLSMPEITRHFVLCQTGLAAAMLDSVPAFFPSIYGDVLDNFFLLPKPPTCRLEPEMFVGTGRAGLPTVPCLVILEYDLFLSLATILPIVIALSIEVPFATASAVILRAACLVALFCLRRCLALSCC
ncbi:unnamed protein product [Meganyctiphanes norvegica]|uniref:Uncharacterized protein n=1 Tax=Meganyctiphanes norvegica TaxID=48144 RepID=A0AAV2QSX3_MEGNR